MKYTTAYPISRYSSHVLIYGNSRWHVLTTLLLDLGLCEREIEKGVRFGINSETFALWPQHWMCSVNEQCVIIDIL